MKISERMAELSHSVVCADRDFESWGAVAFGPRALIQKSFEAIENSDLVLIESTEKGMGVRIEASYAFAKNIPIVTMAQYGYDISVNLRSLSSRVVLYSDLSELDI